MVEEVTEEEVMEEAEDIHPVEVAEVVLPYQEFLPQNLKALNDM